MTTRTAPDRCPNCNYEADCASPITGEDAPGDGDFTLCIDCGEWSVFDANMKLRKPTDAELHEIGLSLECRMTRAAWLSLQRHKKAEAHERE